MACYQLQPGVFILLLYTAELISILIIKFPITQPPDTTESFKTFLRIQGYTTVEQLLNWSATRQSFKL